MVNYNYAAFQVSLWLSNTLLLLQLTPLGSETEDKFTQMDLGASRGFRAILFIYCLSIGFWGLWMKCLHGCRMHGPLDIPIQNTIHITWRSYNDFHEHHFTELQFSISHFYSAV